MKTVSVEKTETVAESAIRSRGKHWREALADLRDELKAVREQ